MVKNAIRRVISRYFPELTERKHLPQLARIEKIYDMPVGGAAISTAFRAHKAADIQLLDAVTHEPLATPIFEQVTLATGQAHERGLFAEPVPGMLCLIQYIDGLDSMPVITSLLPWHTLVPDIRSIDVSLQQSHRCKVAGQNGDWHIQTDGEIKQTSQHSDITSQISRLECHMREMTVTGHDSNHIDGNQVNEVMGALKTIIGEKALIVALDNLLLGSKKQIRLESDEDMTLETQTNWLSQAAGVSKLIGSTVWVGSESVSVVRVLLELIQLVKNMNDTLSGHTHAPDGTPVEKLELIDHKFSAEGLEQFLEPVTE